MSISGSSVSRRSCCWRPASCSPGSCARTALCCPGSPASWCSPSSSLSACTWVSGRRCGFSCPTSSPWRRPTGLTAIAVSLQLLGVRPPRTSGAGHTSAVGGAARPAPSSARRSRVASSPARPPSSLRRRVGRDRHHRLGALWRGNPDARIMLVPAVLIVLVPAARPLCHRDLARIALPAPFAACRTALCHRALCRAGASHGRQLRPARPLQRGPQYPPGRA